MAAAFPVRALILASALALAACGAGEPQASDTLAGAPDTPAAAPDTPADITETTALAGQPAMTLPVDAAEPADCNVPQAAIFAGRRADPAVRAELAAAVAPVTMIRWVTPGAATTDDLRPQRLNVMLDVAGTIVSAHCG